MRRPLGIWQVDIRGRTFGDHQPIHHDANGPQYAGWDTPASNAMPRANGDGLIVTGAARVASKPITFELAIQVDSEETAQHELEEFATAWLPIEDGPIEITFRTPLRTYTCVGMPGRWEQINDWSIRAGYVRIVAQFILTDPRFYSEPVVKNIGLAGVQAGTGMQFPFRFPFRFGPSAGSTGAGVVDIENIGNKATGLGLMLYSSAGIVGPIVGRYFTTDVLRFPLLTVPPGSWLIIDTARKSAEVRTALDAPDGQSVSHEIDRPTSKWFLLPPGPSTVIVAGDGAGSGVVVFRSAWLL